MQSRGFIDSGIDFLEVCHQELDIPVADNPSSVADLMDDTLLNLGLGEYSLNGVREATQTVYTGNQDIPDATVLYAVEYTQPELRALAAILAHPHTQDIADAVHLYSNRYVHSFLHYLTLAANMEEDSVHEYYRVHALQRPLLPFLDHRQDFVRYTARPRNFGLAAV